jgi:protein-serine/threonine kinase
MTDSYSSRPTASQSRPHPPHLHFRETSRNGSAEMQRPSSSSTSQPWPDERILLTPPLATAGDNPLEGAVYKNLNHHAFMANANQQAFAQNAYTNASPGDTLSIHHDATHLISGLHIRTDVPPPRRTNSSQSIDSDSRLRSSASATSLPHRTPSIRANLHSSAGSVSPGAYISSPQIAAMLDITPLPSPTMAAFEPWKAFSLARTRSRGSSLGSSKAEALPPTLLASPISPRRKGYAGLKQSRPPSRSSGTDNHGLAVEHIRTRSISDYMPEPLAVPKPRNIAVSNAGIPVEVVESPTTMHREEFIGAQRRLSKAEASPTAPSQPSIDTEMTHEDEPAAKRPKLEVFSARSISKGEPRSYEAIRELGQGTFSKVYLAVRQVESHQRDSVDYRQDSVNMAGVRARSRRLVAVKVVEHGPAGGADAERIEVGLKREVDLMKTVQHPSLVHLKAFGNDDAKRALLVMNYCPGGDLFEVATKHREVLTPTLVRRIFAELVSAVRYLHQKYIVHRDIKLESRFRCLLCLRSAALTSSRRSPQHSRPRPFGCCQLARTRPSSGNADRSGTFPPNP